jgi:ATP-dependent Clp protease ATP-binding subunit ClpX
VVATLHELDGDALVRILTEPRNSLVKQYSKFFDMENVRLRFTSSALEAIAVKTLERETGARGLRSIVEDIMLEIMYKLPTLTGITGCVITDDVINKKEEPLLVYGDEAQASTG